MLQIFHQTFTRPPWILSFCAALTLFAALPAFSSGVHARTARPLHTDEDLFRGLILAGGPVARRIPEIRDHLMPANFTDDPRLIGAIELFQDQLIEAIRLHEPRFFGSFGTEIRSGDHLRIRAALQRAGSVTASVLRRTESVKSLSRNLREDPGRFQALINRVKQEPGAEDLTEAEIVRALEAVVASSLSDAEGVEDPYSTSAAIVAFIFVAVVAVAAVLVAAAIGVVLLTGAAVLVWTSTSSSGGGNKKKSSSGSLSLLGEQMIDSIALAYGS